MAVGRLAKATVTGALLRPGAPNLRVALAEVVAETGAKVPRQGAEDLREGLLISGRP